MNAFHTRTAVRVGEAEAGEAGEAEASGPAP